jgi:hypothetical protein
LPVTKSDTENNSLTLSSLFGRSLLSPPPKTAARWLRVFGGIMSDRKLIDLVDSREYAEALKFLDSCYDEEAKRQLNAKRVDIG